MLAAAALGLVAADLDPASQPDPLGHGDQRRLLHQRGMTIGQGTFGVGGEALDQQMRDDQAQDPVAQKLQALVGAPAPGVAADGAGVGQGLGQQRRVPKRVPERLLQLGPAPAGGPGARRRLS